MKVSMCRCTQQSQGGRRKTPHQLARLPVFLLLSNYISLDEISKFDFRQLHFKKWEGDVVGQYL